MRGAYTNIREHMKAKSDDEMRRLSQSEKSNKEESGHILHCLVLKDQILQAVRGTRIKKGNDARLNIPNREPRTKKSRSDFFVP